VDANPKAFTNPKRINGQKSMVNGQQSKVNGQKSTANGQKPTANSLPRQRFQKLKHLLN
jgi:hypothetical protein